MVEEIFLWNENFVSTSKNLLKSRNWAFPVVRYFTRKLEFVSNILWTIVETLAKRLRYIYCLNALTTNFFTC